MKCYICAKKDVPRDVIIKIPTCKECNTIYSISNVRPVIRPEKKPSVDDFDLPELDLDIDLEP